MRLVECVPNFSEGRDPTIIKAITTEIEAIDSVKLMDVDMGADTNRTVVTFIGPPEGVEEAAFQAIKKASELIDMSRHQGAHARIGATDVCPFVPVAGVTMDDCVKIANRLGKRVGDELDIPVYLYEYAATKEERKNLAVVRAGEYEGLDDKLKDQEWTPDYGPAKMNVKSGATVMGAREFLIAYNINLASKDRKLAHKIALEIREKGKLKRDANRKIVKDENGNKIYAPGLFKDVKAVGWYMDEFGCSQISINFINYKVSPPHLVFDKVCELANDLGVRITGSELVGLIPKEALLQAGAYYLKKQGKSTGVTEKEVIDIAVRSLGLSDLYPFEEDKKIIESMLAKDKKAGLTDMDLKEFCDELSSDSPAPGGGSVAALNASLAAGLGAMVTNLTYGKKGYEKINDEMSGLGSELQSVKYQLLSDIDKDTESFNELMAAFKMPRKSDADKKSRLDAIETATKKATMIPFSVMEKSLNMIGPLIEIAEKGNENSLSDAGVALLNARSAVEGAFMNVLINLSGIEDSSFREEIKDKGVSLHEQATEKIDKALSSVYKRLGK